MKLVQRMRQDSRDERPVPDEAPIHEERGIRDLSKRDYVRIVRRAVSRFQRDHMMNIAAALAYYSFLAIPSALLLAVGVFSVVAGPSAITTVINKLHGIIPKEATTLLESSLRNMTQHRGTGVAVLSIGGVLALWSLTGAMQNMMWAVNVAYDREDRRGFVRRRLVALMMLAFALLGFVLAFGVLVLGPQLSTWLGNAIGSQTLVKWVWYAGEWPLLIAGLLVAFAGLMFLAPDEEHPRWRFLSFGAILATLLWIGVSGAFAFYVSRFGSYNKAWGSLAAVVVMLTWLWLSNVALLFGATLNAELERSRRSH